MSDKIIDCLNLNTEERRLLIDKGLEQVKKYSWEKMAKETISIYESSKN